MRTLAALAMAFTFAACGSKPTERPTVSPPPSSPDSAEIDGYRITGPWTHKNLSMFLIQRKDAPAGDGKMMTLEEALKAGVLKVSEKKAGAQVNQLEIRNDGDRPIYLQAGDTVKGGQQDRAIAVDTIIPPNSGTVNLAAFCVEPGRWSGRTGKASMAFGVSKAPMATKGQKLAVRLAKNQSEVWDKGKSAIRAMASEEDGFTGEVLGGVGGRDSYVLAAEAPGVKKKIQDYLDNLAKILEGKKDVVGMAFAINGEINSAEIYADTGLFAKLWPKLLRSCSLEALGLSRAKTAGTTTAGEIREFLKEAALGKERIEKRPGDMRVKVKESKKIVFFESEKGGEMYHRQIIRK